MTNTPIDIAALEALLKANETYTRPFTGLYDPAYGLVRAVPELIKAVKERDEWKNQAHVLRDNLQHTEEVLGAYSLSAEATLASLRAERDEWERKYTAIVMGADPKASGTAKTYWAAVERACDEALTGYKHEAREAQSALASLRALLADQSALREIPTSGAKPLDFP